MASYAIFNGEGYCEDFDNACSMKEAEELLASSEWAEEPGVYVDRCCEEHPEQPASSCEDCESEE